MKKLLTILILCTITRPVFSQDVSSLYENHNAAEAQAEALAEVYDIELGLRAAQKLLFMKKVEEYLILSKDVKENYKGKEMLDQLAMLEIKETADMSDILTRIQWQVYKKVRPNIQPLAIVEK